MKIVLALTLLVTGSFAFAYARNEVAGKTYVCGDLTVEFGKPADKAKITHKAKANGAAPQVESYDELMWGNRGLDVPMGDHDFEVQPSGKFTLDNVTCRQK